MTPEERRAAEQQAEQARQRAEEQLRQKQLREEYERGQASKRPRTNTTNSGGPRRDEDDED